MLAYKGFHKGLVCRGYQFKEGVNYTDKANCAKNGFHCAENPIDCLSYYPNINSSEYWIVDACGDIDEDSIDSKIACTELHILKRLTLKQFFYHCLIFLAHHPDARSKGCARDHGEAYSGYTIVVGENPLAKGKGDGDILALLEVDNHNKPICMAVYVVGEGHIRPGKYYDVRGEEYKYV